MSDSDSVKRTKDVLCKFYANNACNKGQDCQFSHVRSHNTNQVCRFYLMGFCAFGAYCRYNHVKPVHGITEENSRSNEERFDATSEVCEIVEPSNIEPSIRWNDNHRSYANAAGSATFVPLCPYHESDECPRGDDCCFVHGNLCELCNYNCLHPFDHEQRKQHNRLCVAAHEEAMNEAFAAARSADKLCGICLENIREKNMRFGILEGCKHCFCVKCIRKWRNSRVACVNQSTLRCCPECRAHSNFIIPALFWVEDPEEKQQLIKKYRENTKQKVCKYIKEDSVDECPFGSECFYKHVLSDGTIIQGETPQKLRKKNIDRVFHQDDLLDNYESPLEDDEFESMMMEMIDNMFIHDT